MASIKIEKTKSLLPRNHSVVGVVRDRKVIRWLKHNKAKWTRVEKRAAIYET